MPHDQKHSTEWRDALNAKRLEEQERARAAREAAERREAERRASQVRQR